jgi:hypothetical protein
MVVVVVVVVVAVVLERGERGVAYRTEGEHEAKSENIESPAHKPPHIPPLPLYGGGGDGNVDGDVDGDGDGSGDGRHDCDGDGDCDSVEVIVVVPPGHPKINISVAEKCHRSVNCLYFWYLGSRRRQRVSR